MFRGPSRSRPGAGQVERVPSTPGVRAGEARSGGSNAIHRASIHRAGMYWKRTTMERRAGGTPSGLTRGGRRRRPARRPGPPAGGPAAAPTARQDLFDGDRGFMIVGGGHDGGDARGITPVQPADFLDGHSDQEGTGASAALGLEDLGVEGLAPGGDRLLVGRFPRRLHLRRGAHDLQAVLRVGSRSRSAKRRPGARSR